MEKKNGTLRTLLSSIAFLILYVILAVGSGSTSSGVSSYGNSSYSYDMYSKPVSNGECAVCGGRGYINRNGETEKCYPCNGTGKATSFPGN